MGDQDDLKPLLTPAEYAERAGVRIRAMEPSDVDSVARIMNERSAYANTMQVPYTSVEYRRKMTFADMHTRFLGAVPLDAVDDAPIGNISLFRNDRPRRIHTAHIGMSIADAWQGRGVGTVLMAVALDVADNWWQVTRVHLEVFVDNEPGVALYRKFGFEIEGVLRADAFRDGEYVDTYSMARILPALERAPRVTR